MSENIYEPMEAIQLGENTPNDTKTMDMDKNINTGLSWSKPSKNNGGFVEHSVWRKRFRAGVCLGLLCVSLLTGILCSLLYQRNHMAICSALAAERDQLQTSYNDLIKDQQQLQTSYVNMTKDRDKLWSETERLNQSLALRGCPPGWMWLEGRCYYTSAELKTWDQSKQDCQERGAHLVTINSPEEQRLVNWMCGVKQYVWIGLTDSATEGNWKWVDGMLLTTVYWANGEPNGGVAENCGYFYSWLSDSGEWWDSSCSSSHRWICQK